MIEALLSLRIPGLWVTPVTEQFDINVSCRVGGQTDGRGWGLVTIKGDDRIIDEAIEYIREHPSVGGVFIRSRHRGNASLTVDVVHCPACEALISSKSFMVFPVDINRGWMKWLLVTDNKSLGNVLDKLENLGINFKVERIIALGGKGVLTDRQEEVVMKALSSGYFDFPRKKDSSKLADELGISVSTLSEIMRAAERRIFSEYFRK